jgi:hypothetical protein
MSFGGIPALNHFLECAELFLFRADSPAFGGIIRQFNDHFDLLGAATIHGAPFPSIPQAARNLKSDKIPITGKCGSFV